MTIEGACGVGLTEGRVRTGSAIDAYLRDLLLRHADDERGAVATYIPELALADPSDLGMCLVTVDGCVYEAGDARVPFTIQSISKPLTYGIALERLGAEAVRACVGVEPSGEAFNEISLREGTGAPLNAMINAGAIACAGLLATVEPDPLELVLATYSDYAGRPLEIDEGVYRSERETGHRNRAIAHLLRNFDVITGPPEAALDLYFRQCSVRLDCTDLATIAATLANGGVNPLTGRRALREEGVRDVLSVMTTCGMYDSAGDWLVNVGLPAKSGVSGGVLAVLPGRLGIAVYSPRVDARGNSVRGVGVCRDLSRDLGLHLVRPGERPPSPLRAATTAADLPSKRVRGRVQRDALAAHRWRTAVFELQGEFTFAAAELLARRLERWPETPDVVVVDVRRVARADAGGLRLLAAIAEGVGERDGTLVLASEPAPPEAAGALQGLALPTFDDLDAAVEWAEDLVLELVACDPAADAVPLDEHGLLAGLTPAERRRVGRWLEPVHAPRGALLVQEGDAATHVFLVTRGALSVLAVNGGGRPQRLATLTAGATFGELAYVGRGVRTADVRADSDVECHVLAYAAIDALAESDPALHGKLLRNLLAVVVATVGRAQADVSRRAG